MSEADSAGGETAGPFRSCPTFFASISSVKANLLPLEELELLVALHVEHFLVSAYDFATATKADARAMHEVLQKAAELNCSVLLDCGNYESYWHRDSGWTRDRFHSAATELGCETVFAFDDQSTSSRTLVSQTVEGVRQDQSKLPGPHIVPIIHIGALEVPAACDAVVAVANAVSADVIAVPERELGNGITERAMRIRTVKNALRASGSNTKVHILGTGNPISLLIYSVAGADSFDGLEWCHTVVDHRTGLLFHMQQFDFFRHQTEYGDGSLPVPIAGRAHNLVFLRQWMHVLQEARKLGDQEALVLTEYLTKKKPSEVIPSVIQVLLTLRDPIDAQ